MSQSKPTILAFDIGTSSIKASIFSRNGEALYTASHALATHYPAPNCVEQEPEDWWAGIVALCRALGEQNKTLLDGVAVIGVGGHMMGCVPVDGTGHALHPALIHADARAIKQYHDVLYQVGEQHMYQLTGNRLDPRSSLCKMKWFAEERPEIYARTARFLQCKDFIVARLTGDIDTTDYSDAAHGELSDITHRRYDQDLYNTLWLDVGKMPRLRRGTEIVSGLTDEAAKQLGLRGGIPVVAGAGDGPCATLGAGAIKQGDAYLCLGTTAWIGLCANAPCFDEKRRIFSIPMANGEQQSITGTMQTACAALNWAMGMVGLDDPAAADAAAEAIDAGSDGLLFLPYLAGERSPIFDPNACGVYFGLTERHARAHILRATMEGVAYALSSILEVFRQYYPVQSLRILGGGGRSALWREIIASTLDVPLDVLNVSPEDVTSIGIAVAAGMGVGMFSSAADGTRQIRVAETIQPNPAWKRTYAQAYPLYAQLYPSLREAMELRRRLLE